ncbi:MAG: PEFG-CTERM sorting domain-containing protein [Thermoproteota archaeon]|nr:PEFG-CTERM sorting domain-containing protein [Thermoproteota archaeon]
MNKIFLLLALIATISFSPVFAQEVTGQKIIVTTDNTAYQQGDVITVTGNVEKILPGTPILLQIFFDRTQVAVDQITVSNDGKFSTTLMADGKLWSTDGVATLRIAYGSYVAETSFDFFKKSSNEGFVSNFEINIPDSGTFDMPYTIRGGSVESVSLNSDNLGFDVEVNTTSDGYIQLQIFRDFVDSIKNDGTDQSYIVLISNTESENSVQSEFRQIESTNEFRTIEIPLKTGDYMIQVIGTFVIPEFGTITQLILIIAIISIIAITAKTRYRFNNF